MPEMPIPADYGRHVAPLTDGQEEPSVFEMLDDNDPLVEEQPDGSAIVNMDELKGPDDSPSFYENLADGAIDTHELDDIAIKYIDLVDKDKQAREDRDKQYEEGLRRTGLGHDAPGGAQFLGASKVVHPVMAEACVDFAARAIKELFPADGPVRTKIIGEVTEEKTSRAERKRDYMNWQLTEQIEEYRDEEEQLLTQLPLGGSQFMKVWWDEGKKRPAVEFVPIDNIYLPYAAGSFYTSSRVTESQQITQEQYDLRVAEEIYIDLDVYRAPMEPEESKSQKANNKIEGRKNQSDNVDGVREVFHITTWLTLEDDKFSKGERAPYILMIDQNERSVIGLYRNWEDGDDTCTKLDHIIEFKFIPWRGAYAIGLPHLIGGLSAALTGALRALLDSAHINTAPTMLKLKGAKISGQTTVIEPTQVSEIEGAPGVDDIRKIAMPVPFNQPSPVLFQLLGWLDNAAKGVVTTSEEKIADVTSNAPVGTTQALIEQGAAVYSSIHARLHDSQRRVLKVLARLNRWYLDDQRRSEVVADLKITSDDFKSNSDIIPVSDPHIFAETQRYAQIQTLAARAAANPDLYNRLEVEKRILKQIKIPDINQILPDKKDVDDMNFALENVAMTLGKPVGAFPSQNHLAHILGHLNYASDPVYGSNPIIAPTFIPNCLEHLKQHLTMWYLQTADTYASEALGRPFDIMKTKPIMNEAQRLLAGVMQHVHQDTQETLAPEVVPAIQAMMQMMQKFQGQTPQDPASQALLQSSMEETKRKAAYDKADLQLRDKKIQQDSADKQAALTVQEQIKAAELTNSVTELTIQKQFEARKNEQQSSQQLQQGNLDHLQKMNEQAASTQTPQPSQGELNV